MLLPRVAPFFRRGFASKATELAPTFLADLRQILGLERVATGATVRAQHGQDAGPHTGAPPQAVVWPETREQVHRMKRYVGKIEKGVGRLPTLQQCRSAFGAGWKRHRLGRRNRRR